LASIGLLALAACGPSIDSAAKADIDHRLSAMAPSGQTFPAPVMVVPKPLVVGQWTQHRLINDKGQPSLSTYKVVGEDGGAYWVEVANESYYGKTVTKILLAIPDRANPSTMEIRAVKMKDKKGRVTELEGPMIQLMRSAYQGSVNMLAVSWQGLPRESANVVAGHFSDCYKARTDASWGVWHAASTAWMHPMVPISGLVKSEGVDHPTSMELVGFGEVGATSEIP
jgi:hypothetical protein